jgi:competence protein ComEA
MKKSLCLLLLGLAFFRPDLPLLRPVAAQSGATQKAQVDINKANEATLRTVPGIGAAYAQKIIAGRPYKSKDELWRKKILPQGVYDKVKDHLVAHQGK